MPCSPNNRACRRTEEILSSRAIHIERNHFRRPGLLGGERQKSRRTPDVENPLPGYVNETDVVFELVTQVPIASLKPEPRDMHGVVEIAI